jgi:DNA-binding response OmpR family regulator
VLEFRGIRLDVATHEVTVRDRKVTMPLREFELLHFLLANADHVVSRQQIRDHVWGIDYPGETNTVVVHVRRLRSRLGDDTSNPHIIKNIRGRGYRLVGLSH